MTDLLLTVKKRAFKEEIIRQNPQIRLENINEMVNWRFPGLYRHISGLHDTFTIKCRDQTASLSNREVCQSQLQATLDYFHEKTHTGSGTNIFYQALVTEQALKAVSHIQQMTGSINLSHNQLSQDDQQRESLSIGFFTTAISTEIPSKFLNKSGEGSHRTDLVFPGVLLLLQTLEDEQQLNIYPRLYRLICSNGAIGKAIDNNFFHLPLSRDKQLGAQIFQQAIEPILNEEIFNQAVKNLYLAAKTAVHNPLDLFGKYMFLHNQAVRKAAIQPTVPGAANRDQWQHKLTDLKQKIRTPATRQMEGLIKSQLKQTPHRQYQQELKAAHILPVLSHYERNNNDTLWGLINAVTETARDTSQILDAIALEQLAGRMLFGACNINCSYIPSDRDSKHVSGQSPGHDRRFVEKDAELILNPLQGK